jgi:hypothetical protein
VSEAPIRLGQTARIFSFGFEECCATQAEDEPLRRHQDDRHEHNRRDEGPEGREREPAGTGIGSSCTQK